MSWLNRKNSREIGIILLYAMIFFILTYPLVFNFTSGIAGRYLGDGHIFIWNAWELQKQLSSFEVSLFTTDILFPHRLSLSLHTYTALHSFFAAIVNLFVNNLVLSFNLIYLLSTIASAYLAYRFFYLLTQQRLIAVLAGEIFTFQALWSTYAIFGTQNLLNLWFVPATLLAYETYRQTDRRQYLLLAGFVIGLAFVNGFYPFIFSLTGVALYGLLTHFIIDKRSFFSVLTKSVTLFLGFLASAAWKITALVPHGDYIKNLPLPTVADVDFYHADPVNLIRPVQFHALWGSWHTWFTPEAITNGNAFIGFAGLFIIGMFLYTRFKTRRRLEHKKILTVFLIGYGVIILLSFGPYLHLFGWDTDIPMLHYGIQKLFIEYNNFRSPGRWLLLGQFFLAGIFTYLLIYITKHRTRAAQTVLIVLLMIGFLLDVAYLPREIIDFSPETTHAYQLIRDDATQGTVLYIPFAITSGYFHLGEKYHPTLSRQIIHERPVIGGHLSRLSFEIRDAYRNEPVFRYLFNYKSTEPSDADLSSENIQNFHETYQVRFVTIDKQLVDLSDTHVQALVRYMTQSLGFSSWFDDPYTLVLKK